MLFGRHDQALATIDKTIAELDRCGDLFMPELHRIRGEVLEKMAEERGADEAFCRSIELADQQLKGPKDKRSLVRSGAIGMAASFGALYVQASLERIPVKLQGIRRVGSSWRIRWG